MRLLLLRHGQTTANVRGELDTAIPGPGLTPLGMAQAASVPSGLRGEAVDAIFASQLIRTQQTAAPLAADRGLAVTVLDGIHEIEAGELELATDRESYRRFFEVCIAWGGGDRDRVMPGAANGHGFFARFDAAIDAIGEVGTAVVVSHAAAMRVWIAGTARNIEPAFTAQQELDNTGLVVLEGSRAGWDLVEWRGSPVGGAALADDSAEDPTGEPVDDALA